MRTLLRFLIVPTVSITLFTACAVSDGSRTTDDLPEVWAQGGCFDAVVLSDGHEPPVDLETAAENAREYLNDWAEANDRPYSAGELAWAKYGELAHGGHFEYGFPLAGNVRWVLIFETEPNDWWARLGFRRIPNRWTAIYSPEHETVGSACSSYSLV